MKLKRILLTLIICSLGLTACGKEKVDLNVTAGNTGQQKVDSETAVDKSDEGLKSTELDSSGNTTDESQNSSDDVLTFTDGTAVVDKYEGQIYGRWYCDELLLLIGSKNQVEFYDFNNDIQASAKSVNLDGNKITLEYNKLNEGYMDLPTIDANGNIDPALLEDNEVLILSPDGSTRPYGENAPVDAGTTETGETDNIDDEVTENTEVADPNAVANANAMLADGERIVLKVYEAENKQVELKYELNGDILKVTYNNSEYTLNKDKFTDIDEEFDELYDEDDEDEDDE